MDRSNKSLHKIQPYIKIIQKIFMMFIWY